MTPAVSDEVSGLPIPRATGPGPDKGNRTGRKGGSWRSLKEKGGGIAPAAIVLKAIQGLSSDSMKAATLSASRQNMLS